MVHVNQTFAQAKEIDYPTLGKFLVIGAAKILFFAAFIWMIRHI